MKSRKGMGWLFTPILGMPFIVLALLIIMFMVFVFGILFLFKNLIWISIVVGGLFIAYQMAKNKRMDTRSFLAFIIIILTVWLLGHYVGLMALGVQNTQHKVDISISTMDTGAPLLSEYGYDYSDFRQDTTSFTCESQLFNKLGCRIAPYSYRPVKIEITNKDPELPLPPSIIVVAVDGPSIRVGQKITLEDIRKSWGETSHGDVFLVPGDEASWRDKIIQYFNGQSIPAHLARPYHIFYITKPLMPGQKLQFGVDPEGKPTLFLVAAKGAQINKEHIVQVMLLETTTSDAVVRTFETQIMSWGWLTLLAPVVGGALAGGVGAIVGAVIPTVLFTADSVAKAFQVTAPRTVYAVGAYKFIVAYPTVEILIILGAIGVVALVITKLLKLW